MLHAGAMAVSRDEIDPFERKIDLFLERGREHGERRPIGLAVIQYARHAGSLSRIATRFAKSVRPNAQHALVAGRA